MFTLCGMLLKSARLKMTPAIIEIYCAIFLTVEVVIVCEAVSRERGFTMLPQYGDRLSTNTYIFLFEVKGVNLQECALQCLIFKHECTGIFYNTFLKTCKALRSGQSTNIAYVHLAGWNFWSKGKCIFFFRFCLFVFYGFLL
jgi:hypothetical protein